MPGVPLLTLPNSVPECHQVIRELHAYVVELVEHSRQQADEIARLKKTCADQATEIAQLRQELKQLKRKLFGQSRERFLGDAESQSSSETTGKEPESPSSASGDSSTLDSPQQSPASQTKRRRTSKGRRPRKINPLWPREKRLHRLRESDVPAELWNDPDAKRFFRLVREEIEVPDATPKVIEHYQEVIVVERKNAEVLMRSATMPVPFLEGCYVSPSFVACLITSRFSDHIPYYRIEDILSRMGLNLHRSTQWRWAHGAARVLKPLVDLIRSRVRRSKVMGIDETPIPILCADRCATRKAYLYAQYGDADSPYAAFHFADHKTEENVRKIVGDFRGYMQSDAYICYELIAAASNSTILPVACWTHARRKFEPLAKDDHPGAKWILSRIAELYDIEDLARGMTNEQRHALRQQESRPIVERIARWLDERDALETPKAVIREGVNYLWNRWEMFTRFLEDGAIPIDNNRTEAMIKTSAPQWGRKDRLFDRSTSVKSGYFRPFASRRLARSLGSRRNRMSDTAKRELPRFQPSA